MRFVASEERPFMGWTDERVISITPIPLSEDLPSQTLNLNVSPPCSVDAEKDIISTSTMWPELD